MLGKSKLNGTKSKISEVLINNESIHENFMLIINEEKTIVNLKKALEWWIVKEVIIKRIIWLKKTKKRHWQSY